MTRDAVLKILKQYYDANRERYGIIRLGVFGSVARDEATEDSDVDVIVALAKPDMFARVHICHSLRRLLGVDVDVIRYREKMNQLLKRRIDEEAVYV